MLLHSTFQQLHSNITCASLVLYCCFTQLHINFTSTSLLLYMHFTVAYKLHHMHLNFTAASQQNHMHFVCTSLLPHSTLEQLHLYFTVVSLALHSNFTAASHAFHLLLHSTWKQHHMYFLFVLDIGEICTKYQDWYLFVKQLTIFIVIYTKELLYENFGWCECFIKTLTCITHTDYKRIMLYKKNGTIMDEYFFQTIK